MKKLLVAVAAVASLSACSGSDNPFAPEEETETGTDGGDGGGGPIESDRVVPPGTPEPTAATGIYRSEPTSAEGGNTGDGFARGISYDAATDTFTVDNLAFDGTNTYSRGTAVGQLGPYAVYEAAAQYPDTETGRPINQLSHRAIYGVSRSGNSQFAIVRTGAYTGYGFGGFVYQRDNNVVVPSTGQARYSGKTSGMRDFDGSGGLQYSTGDIEVAIDFDDFNDATGTRGDGVRGHISNRRIFDINGNEVTAAMVSAINTDKNASLGAYPDANFVVGPGVLDNNGEILGSVDSTFVDNDGKVQKLEEGNYYAILSGTNAEEIVGVVVLQSTVNDIKIRDTSGFVVYRTPPFP
ncbi:MAG: hypothetical protein ACK5MY_02355 [Jhaorihella sp.]